jgi:Tol biopolymer transport system component
MSGWRTSLVLALGFLLTEMAGPSLAVGASAEPSSTGETIAYERLDADWEIYSSGADGSGATNLTEEAGLFSDDRDPAWSPDGTRIAFSSLREGEFESSSDIYVMNEDGTGRIRLTNSSDVEGEPTWSPDGTRIAYTRCCPGGNSEIFAMNADGTSVTNLTDHPGWDSSPAWSPDGGSIAFDTNRDDVDASEIYVMNPDGTDQRNLTSSGFQDFSPAWSPDGSRIAFVSDGEDWNEDIYVVNRDGSGRSRLTTRTEVELAPGWSADGSRIAFSSYEAGNPEIFVMQADGTGAVNITNSSPVERNPAWRPMVDPPEPALLVGSVRNRDGKRIAGALVSWSGPQSGSTTTGLDGRYEMTSSTSGSYLVTASTRLCRSRSTSVQLEPGTTSVANFRLRC